MAVESRVVQEDFAGGSTIGNARYLIPDHSVYSLENMLASEDGSVFARGGVETKSANRTISQGEFIWEGLVGDKLRTLVADDSKWYVLDEDDVTLVEIADGGLSQPRVAAELTGYLFIGEGWIYGGSRKPSQTLDVTVTPGSKTVGINTQIFDLDPGMIFHTAGAGDNERVYRVESVDGNTITLSEAWEGNAGNANGYFDGIYKIQADDNYPVSNWYATINNRMFATEPSEPSIIKMSTLNTPLPPLANPHEWSQYDYHEVADGGEILGAKGIGNLMLVFATNGLWVLAGTGQQIVNEATGAPQHSFSALDRSLVLKDIVGVADWENMLIVPAMDGAFLVDGISTPRKITGALELPWQREMKERSLGIAATFGNYYILPIFKEAAHRGDDPATMLCRLDLASLDGRRLSRFGWSYMSGSGSKMAGYVARTLEPGKLLSLERLREAAEGAAVCDATMIFAPEHPDNGYDQDGSIFEPSLVTRDMETGGLTENVIRKLRLAREHVSVHGVDPDEEARALLDFGTGAVDRDVAYWGHPDGQWGAGFGPPSLGTVGDRPWTKGGQDRWFPVHDRNGAAEAAPPDEGREPFDFRLGRRGVGTSLRRYYGRFRIWSDRPATKWVIQRIEMHSRPAGSTRR